jgi:hypothetical protein
MDDELKIKLVQETARMRWRDLQEHFAAGATLYVSPELDLLDVACKLSRDDSQVLKPYIDKQMVCSVSDDRALVWFEDDTEMWTLVIRPWVLVQPVRQVSNEVGKTE